MVEYICGNCGFDGDCYGIPTTKGVTAPFCPKCGKNDKLTKKIKDEKHGYNPDFDFDQEEDPHGFDRVR